MSAPSGPAPDRAAVTPLQPRVRAVTRTLPSPASVQGTLALEWVLPGGLPAEPSAAPALRRVRPADEDAVDPAVAQVPASRADLPEPGAWTGRLVQAVLEVLAHERPRTQLVRWLSPDVYADLGVHLGARPPGVAAGGRARRTVSSVHVFEPADGVVEATAVVVGGRRARAVAVRLEGWDGRWRCTRLAVL